MPRSETSTVHDSCNFRRFLRSEVLVWELLGTTRRYARWMFTSAGTSSVSSTFNENMSLPDVDKQHSAGGRRPCISMANQIHHRFPENVIRHPRPRKSNTSESVWGAYKAIGYSQEIPPGGAPGVMSQCSLRSPATTTWYLSFSPSSHPDLAGLLRRDDVGSSLSACRRT